MSDLQKYPYTKTALFRAITQRVVVIPYWRFGTTYWSHLQGLGIDRLSGNVGKK